jgi:mono/diheme cytochrome c family protein
LVLRWGIVVALVVVVLAGGTALTRHDPIASASPAPRTGFGEALIARGAELAGVGNCASCHTTENGSPYAGGVPLKTQFGTIHGTNLTPDPTTGIGDWPEAAFVRAMREGVSRDGHLLYPAFPYTHFTHTTDADLHALYAFLMTRDPVHAEPTPNKLVFPLQFRPLIAGWNALYFKKGEANDPVRSEATTDRGAYLVESLAHCGACHTKRNALGAEEGERRLDGNLIDGWYAPPLDPHSPSPLPWSVDAMTTYLRTGLVADHAVAGGPMQEAVSGLSRASEADVAAIATYIVANLGPADAARTTRAGGAQQRAATPLAATPTDDPQFAMGAGVYAATCARCHDLGRGLTSESGLQMSLAVALYDDDPHTFVRIVRDGIKPPTGETGRLMPAYGTSLSDDQIVALSAYLRHAAAAAPPWPKLADVVKQTRQ